MSAGFSPASPNADAASTALVTGAAGLIGSHLVEALAARGHRVIAIDNFNDYYDVAQKRANVAGFSDLDEVTLIEADIRDADRMHAIFDEHQPTMVGHMAAMANVRYSIGRAPLYVDVNISGSVNLLEAAKAIDEQRDVTTNFVFASTSSAYGKTDRLPFREDDPANTPLSAYPASKKAVELLGYTYHNLHGLDFTAVRFFSVYGPRARPDMMPFMVTDRIARGETITLFDRGELWSDWTFVDDIVQGVVLAMEKPLGYEVINLGRGEPVKMADFVREVEQLVGKQAILDCPPAPPSEPKRTHADITKARNLLGYDPQTPVQDGLAKLWGWYRDR
ncbi:MAG: NAD-dependent epimerase/dehydratase family protein [Planctomycetota bacterium]